MKLFTGKVKGRKYALTIESAKERNVRDPHTGDLIPMHYHLARMIVAIDTDVDDVFEREFRVIEGEDGSLTDPVAKHIKYDMTNRAREHIYPY